jgi:hypothetical protein
MNIPIEPLTILYRILALIGPICWTLAASPTPLADENASAVFAEFDQEGSDWEWWEEFTGVQTQDVQCEQARSEQLAYINTGNRLRMDFLTACKRDTGSSRWCDELIRPNPRSREVFRCTYGPRQPHQLIHPDRETWTYAFQAVNLVEELKLIGIGACQIYNWWRPEPYNRNVGGAAGRHPFGTSVDVRFCSLEEMERAFIKLCEWRQQGRLRAIGYYGSAGLHFGIGDRTPNTWGKRCP